MSTFRKIGKFTAYVDSFNTFGRVFKHQSIKFRNMYPILGDTNTFLPSIHRLNKTDADKLLHAMLSCKPVAIEYTEQKYGNPFIGFTGLGVYQPLYLTKVTVIESEAQIKEIHFPK